MLAPSHLSLIAKVCCFTLQQNGVQMGLGFEQDFGLRICNVGCFADVPGTGKLWEGGAGVNM